ncbi:hypothetical protein B0O99DRAFT_636725 [Bisporella sp. PMI_857]|nr:hypothetical protein B0O99DRAFT_636725 [Bisporella sp. PMI_857]
MLCIRGLALFFGSHVRDFFGALVATYSTLRVYLSYSNEVYDMLVAWYPLSHFPIKNLFSIRLGT